MSNILNEIINSKSSCIIIPHKSPDGDCLGSSLTLSNFFTKNNCDVQVVLDEVIPTNFRFLDIASKTTSEDFLKIKKRIDYAIVVDTSDIERIGANKDILDLCDNIVVIDHHKTNNYFGDFNIVEMVSSVGEIIYKLYTEIGYEIDKTDSIGLYTSIITDTGNLRYSNTTSDTLRTVANLFDTGFDFEQINRNIYSNQELKKVKLKGEVISGLELFSDGKIVVLEITKDLIKKLDCQMFHSDGIVEAGRDIDGVEVSVLLKEVDKNIIKVSMRSKEYVDLSEISLIFNGGGHSKAAGCTIESNLEEVKKIIVEEISKRL